MERAMWVSAFSGFTLLRSRGFCITFPVMCSMRDLWVSCASTASIFLVAFGLCIACRLRAAPSVWLWWVNLPQFSNSNNSYNSNTDPGWPFQVEPVLQASSQMCVPNPHFHIDHGNIGLLNITSRVSVHVKCVLCLRSLSNGFLKDQKKQIDVLRRCWMRGSKSNCLMQSSYSGSAHRLILQSLGCVSNHPGHCPAMKEQWKLFRCHWSCNRLNLQLQFQQTIRI